ncbi:hypothetical protein Q4372_14580 [Acinetobacter baumannii]|nr:hypothetical protein [Acinetobacter baumannii]
MGDLLFQDSDFVSTRTDLPTVQNVSDVLPSTRYELDAYGHWVFYGNKPFEDKVNGRLLTVQNGASVQPAFTNDGAVLTNAKGSALMSDLVDNANVSVTAIYVAKVSGAGLFLMGMTLPTSGITTENGFGAYISTNKVSVNFKPAVASANGAISGFSNNQAIVQTSPFLVAVSIDKTNKTALLYTMAAGEAAYAMTSFFIPYESANKVIAIGNAYYQASEGGARTTFSEAILYNRALAISEIKAVALRCRARLKGKNIII